MLRACKKPLMTTQRLFRIFKRAYVGRRLEVERQTDRISLHSLGPCPLPVPKKMTSKYSYKKLIETQICFRWIYSL